MVRTGDMVPGSLHALLEVLVWSLQALAEGVFPRCDHKGREFSDGLISGRGSSLADRQNTRFSPCRFWAESGSSITHVFRRSNGPAPGLKGYEPKRAAVAGLPLAGGFVGAWAELRGDWKFLKEVHVFLSAVLVGT